MFLKTENLTPSELKKIKRKQRKAQKKAELEREKQKAEQEKRDQNKNKTTDGELDGPKEEELVPDKLARVCFLFMILLFFHSIYLESSSIT